MSEQSAVNNPKKTEFSFLEVPRGGNSSIDFQGSFVRFQVPASIALPEQLSAAAFRDAVFLDNIRLRKPFHSSEGAWALPANGIQIIHPNLLRPKLLKLLRQCSSQVYCPFIRVSMYVNFSSCFLMSQLPWFRRSFHCREFRTRSLHSSSYAAQRESSQSPAA